MQYVYTRYILTILFFANIFAGKKRVAHLPLSAELEMKKRHTFSSSKQKSRLNQYQSRYQTLDTRISKLLLKHLAP